MSQLNIPYETKYEEATIVADGDMIVINPITSSTRRNRVVGEKLIISASAAASFRIIDNLPWQYLGPNKTWNSGEFWDLQITEGGIFRLVGRIAAGSLTAKLWYRIQ